MGLDFCCGSLREGRLIICRVLGCLLGKRVVSLENIIIVLGWAISL